jgi:hypothetical protein|nr:MAG TPA: hypothetical protein [Crassvirales sp.]
MGTNTGLGIGIGIPFKNNALGGDKPYFPPELKARMIGVWTNYGKKNTDADRNIIKNKIPNAGGDLEILNAAYKLNSGFGEYSEDFTTWTKSSKITSVDSESFDFVTNVNWNLLYYKSNIGKDIPSFKVRIKLKGEGKVFYNYITSEGVYTNEAITSEEYVTPISYNTKYTGETPVNCGFTIGITSEEGSGTITQIPNFEDAFVSDGINDMIVSQKTLQEMGVTKELTIVSMIHQISWRGSAFVPLTNQIRPTDNIYARNQIADIGKTGIYGYVVYDIKNSTVGNSHIVNTILGDKNDYSIYTIGDLSQGKFSVQGYIDSNSNIRETSSVAHYWTFAVLGKATEDEINLIIGNYNLDRSLKPDILCNIGKQGITNENHAEFNDKLIDYSGNGRDIQMNNLAWKGGSGIAAKPFETIKDYTIVSDEARQKLTIYNEFSYKIKSNTPSYYWTVQSIIRDNTSYQVTIITDKDCYWINTTSFINSEGNKESIRKKYPVLANTPTQVIICGLDQFEYPEGIEPTSAVSYVNLEYAGEITITFIPSHKGGLLLNGVNDFGKVTGMPIYKDYTVVADYVRTFAKENVRDAPILSKSQVAGDGAFLFNYLNVNSVISSYSFGTNNVLTNVSDSERKIYYQSKYVNGGKSINSGTGTDYDSMWLGTYRDDSQIFFTGAIYSLMTFPYSMSEFLIERQLKKHKLGTLYPDMVEFRPVIKSSVELVNKPSFAIRGTSTLLNTGDYIPENSEIWMAITMNNVADRITKFVINGNTIDIPSSAYNPSTMKYGFPFTIDSKSPQKITMTIEQDENYVQWNPVVTSNVEYNKLDFYLNNYQKIINVGDYIPKDAYVRANFYLKNNVDELTVFTFNGVNIGYRRSSVDDTAFNIGAIYNYDSPQEVNITVDEYIRYEDIVQPYPSFVKLENLDRTYTYTWGDKLKVGDTIRYNSSVNLLEGAYTLKGQLECNGVYVYDNNQYITVAKEMIFAWTNSPIWSIDDNEPKCILSPRLLRIPNSSYKILGYIPDISGHGNHGKINNSAYAEGSGVNEDGSYQFDGVDDFVTIPTTVGGKQVLMKVNWNTINSIIYDQRTNGGFAIFNSDFDTNENKVPAYRARNIGGSTYIDGILNEYIYASELKDITHNIVELCDPELNTGTLNPQIGSSFLNASYTQMSLYDFMLFDEISTDDKIKELNEYVGVEAKVELPPYYWDAYGKTNLDADKATIQQRGVAVGDYDITNYNHAYDKMSGYGGYEFAKFDNELDWYLTPNNNHIDVVSRNGYEITLKNLSTSVNGWYFQNSGVIGFITRDIPFKVRANKSIRVYWDMHSYKISSEEAFGHVISITALNPNEDTSINLRHLTEEELAELDANKDRMYYLLWFDLSTLAVNEEVTIEMLPLYPNGLVYDAVTDYSKNSNIPALDDFTAIMKRKWLKKQGCPLIKGSKVYEGGNGNALLFEWDKAYNFVFYKRTDIIEGELPDNISFITPTNYNGNVITRGSEQDTNGICIAGDGNAGFANMVFYKLILYPKTIPLLQINFLKNLMERDEIIDLNNPIFIKNE